MNRPFRASDHGLRFTVRADDNRNAAERARLEQELAHRLGRIRTSGPCPLAVESPIAAPVSNCTVWAISGVFRQFLVSVPGNELCLRNRWRAGSKRAPGKTWLFGSQNQRHRPPSSPPASAPDNTASDSAFVICCPSSTIRVPYVRLRSRGILENSWNE